MQVEVTTDQGISSSTSVKARIDNLSNEGLCLISDYIFELGQIISFPESMPCSSGTVVWTYQSKQKCKAGVQFNTS